ncbi:MAG: SDR family NAD(P)-dependent oxidoreductase [Actinobacteria bacterium]|jgi:all-trans-retinol dehydrogenase (NAD+)|nr:MAG: SDR family NAD(P)-dependent oxidoreductase [Actinomycetota bacterium]
MKELRGKNVLITGGALGMGRSLARLLLEEGCRVAIVDIREAELEEAREELSRLGEIASFLCDVSKKEDVYALENRVRAAFGTINILVNNAGIVKSNPFVEKPDEVIEHTVAVNLLACFWTMKAFLPGMVEREEGHVVNMASAGGLLGVPYISDYCATKFAVIGLTESLRQEFKLRGLRKIRFTYVCPNTVGTGMFAGASPVKGTRLLSAEDVTTKIVQGIKKNRSFIGVPLSVYLVPLTKAITPIPMLDLFNRVMGIATSSETTVGRPD